jgi:hypothetical protein
MGDSYRDSVLKSSGTFETTQYKKKKIFSIVENTNKMIDRQKFKLNRRYANRKEMSLLYHTDADEVYGIFGLWIYFGCSGYKRIPIDEIFGLMKGTVSIGKILKHFIGLFRKFISTFDHITDIKSQKFSDNPIF